MEEIQSCLVNKNRLAGYLDLLYIDYLVRKEMDNMDFEVKLAWDLEVDIE